MKVDQIEKRNENERVCCFGSAVDVLVLVWRSTLFKNRIEREVEAEKGFSSFLFYFCFLKRMFDSLC